MEILYILPIYYKKISISIEVSVLKERLERIISTENNQNYPFKGTIKKEESFSFSKRDISLTIKSELVYDAKILSSDNGSTDILIKGRYKLIPALWYLFLICIFSLLIWNINANPIKFIVPLIPYIVMVIKIKIKSNQIISELESKLDI